MAHLNRSPAPLQGEPLLRRVTTSDPAPRRAPQFRSWAWLDSLRSRLDFGFEVLNLDLTYTLAPAGRTGAVDIRSAMVGERAALKAAATHVLRLARPRSFTAGGVRIRAFRLLARSEALSQPIGLLLVGEALSSEVIDAESLDLIDRRLDAAGQWLTAAIEWASSALDVSQDEGGGPNRLGHLLEVIEAFTAFDRAADLMLLVVEAIAIWHDVDVRAYRQDVTGAFQLTVWLPGIDIGQAVRVIADTALWQQPKVVYVESPATLEEIGWDSRGGDTRFVPIARPGESAEWLLTVVGPGDEDLMVTLEFFRRFLTLYLSDLERGAEDALRRRVLDSLVLGDAPFHATIHIALQAAARGIGASAGALDVFYSGANAPALSATWGQFVALAPELANTTNHEVTLRTGADVVGAFRFQKQIGTFSLADVRLARCAVTTFAAWLSGALGHHREIKPADPAGPPVDFLTRVRGEVDRAARDNRNGALLIVGLKGSGQAPPVLDRVADLVQRQLRDSDVVGAMMDAPDLIGALVSGVPSPVIARVADRIVRAMAIHGVDASLEIVPFTTPPASLEGIIRRSSSRTKYEPGLS